MEDKRLERIIDNIDDCNPALGRGKQLLEWVNEGPHRQSDAYAAGVYLFIGGDPHSALEALSYGIQKNKLAYGPGLKGETPPDGRTDKVIAALKQAQGQLGYILSRADECCSRRPGNLTVLPQSFVGSTGISAEELKTLPCEDSLTETYVFVRDDRLAELGYDPQVVKELNTIHRCRLLGDRIIVVGVQSCAGLRSDTAREMSSYFTRHPNVLLQGLELMRGE